MKPYISAMFLSLASILTMNAYAEPAYVVKDFGCPGFIPNPATDNGYPPIGEIFTTQTQGVGAIEDKIGQYTCHFNFDNNDFGLTRATSAKGFPCAAEDRNGNLVYTLDSRMLATPAGKALMECKFHAPKD